MTIQEVESRLWTAANQLWANTGLRPSQFSTPVLGLIFLRYAEKRFADTAAELKKKGVDPKKTDKYDYQEKGVPYLPEKARFSYLLALPESANLGKLINEAMAAIENENEELKGVLPRNYTALPNATLIELLRLLGPLDFEGDVFGQIYEFFLGEFALAEGQKGGVFYTPTSIVKLIVEIIEPYHGRIFDPACGSGGMFVQSAEFVRRHKKNVASELTVFGTEKDGETVKLSKMNLAIHGLSGDIRESNTYYEDPHKALARFDFVMANPPFNVSGVDKERLKTDKRFPFGLPSGDNANYLWIQLFYSSLSKDGRAGFVMHNSATDSDFELRKSLIEDGVVDVVLLTSANLFYTVNLPCSLWFLDKGKQGTPRSKEILFIDARGIYTQVSTALRKFSDSQTDMLSKLVKSYRGEKGVPRYRDIAGLCKRVSVNTVRATGYTLNPKVYVDHVAESADNLNINALSRRVEELLSEVSDITQSVADSLGCTLPTDRHLLLEVAKILFAQAANTSTKTKTFRDVLEHYIGGTWGKDTPDNQHSVAVRIIRGTDIENVAVGEISGCPVRFVKPSQLASRRLLDGDIVIEVSGGGKEQTTGRSTFITEALLDSSAEPLVCASFCKLLRVDPKRLKPTVAYFFLQQFYDLGKMSKYEVQSTGIKNFQTELFLGDVSINTPDTKAQQRFDESAYSIMRLAHVLGRLVELERQGAKAMALEKSNKKSFLFGMKAK